MKNTKIITAKADAKVYVNGLVIGASAVAGVLHLGAELGRKAGIDDTATIKESAAFGYGLPAKGMEMLLDTGKTLTDDEIKAIEAQALAVSQTTGADYAVLVRELLANARK